MVYGCTGYTGRLVLDYAKSINLSIIAAGRTEVKVKAFANQLDVPYRAFDVNDTQRIDVSLQDVQVLLNCSGPFKYTAKPLIHACIRNGAHYIDIAAELDSYQVAEGLDQEARDADVLLMPGCGGSVAMLGCLARYALEGIERPMSVDIALHVTGTMSRGSAVSASENLSSRCLKRRNGALVEQDANATVEFDFGNDEGKVACFPVTLPDLITIWKSTKAPNIQTYVHVSASEDGFPTGNLAEMADGPTREQREANSYHASAVVVSEDGTTRQAVLHTVNGYTFTARASVEGARRIVGGVGVRGFQTPVDVFGARFVHSVGGSEMERN